MVSICCCSRSRVSSSRPVNSMPMPTPPSQDRTTAGVLTLSASSQKVMFKTLPTGSGQHGLDITATTAYVCRFRLHVRADAVLVAYFDGKGNPVPRKLSLVVARTARLARRGSGACSVCCISFSQGQGCPSTRFTPTSIFCACPASTTQITLQRAFLSPTWTADHVSRLQLSLQAGELGPVMADVPGLGVVQEWTTVRTHAKHSDRQLYIQPGL